jgi:excisionase family DNA binding protein
MNPQTATDRYLKLREVQDLLGVSRTTVWRWHAERGLKIVRIGDVARVRESDLQAFLNRHETSGAGVDSPGANGAGVQTP